MQFLRSRLLTRSQLSEFWNWTFSGLRIFSLTPSRSLFGISIKRKLFVFLVIWYKLVTRPCLPLRCRISTADFSVTLFKFCELFYPVLLVKKFLNIKFILKPNIFFYTNRVCSFNSRLLCRISCIVHSLVQLRPFYIYSSALHLSKPSTESLKFSSDLRFCATWMALHIF